MLPAFFDDYLVGVPLGKPDESEVLQAERGVKVVLLESEPRLIEEEEHDGVRLDRWFWVVDQDYQKRHCKR